MAIEFPSEEMELATQQVREITEKEDDIELDFAQLDKKYRDVMPPPPPKKNNKKQINP